MYVSLKDPNHECTIVPRRDQVHYDFHDHFSRDGVDHEPKYAHILRHKNVMRGLVLEGATLRFSLLQATALVLLSGRNGLHNGGESDRESTPERTSTNNPESDPSPVMDFLDPEVRLWADDEATSHLHETLTSWFSPDVISTMATRLAVPSGSKRNHSDVEGTPLGKKPRCNILHDPPNLRDAAASSDDRMLENVFAAVEGSAADETNQHCSTIDSTQNPTQAEIAETAQQHVMPMEAPLMDSNNISLALTPDLLAGPLPVLEHCEDWPSLSTWLEGLSEIPFEEAEVTESIECDASHDAVLGRQVAPFSEPAHVIHGGPSADATTPALTLSPAPVFSTKSGATDAQQLLPKQIQNTRLAGHVQSMPTQEDPSVSKIIAGPALTASQARTSRDHLLAGASHSATSASHSKSTFDEENILKQTSRSSAQISNTPSTSVNNLSERSDKAVKERRSAVYDAALKLLLSPEGAKSIPGGQLERMRPRMKTGMANAPYLSASWLLERLVLQDRTPAYSAQVQVAFECYGYDNVSISDLSRKAVDLAYTLIKAGKARVTDPKHLKLNRELAYFGLAAEIIHDVFFNNRPLRPNFRTYLRNKLRIQDAGKFKLHNIRGHLRKQKGDWTKFGFDLRSILRVINSKASVSHPLNFISFLTDVCAFSRSVCQRKMSRMVEESSASTNRDEQSEVIKNEDFGAEVSRVTEIVTKYNKLFGLDLPAEVEALLEAAPDEGGATLFESAVEEGYVPANLLQTELMKGRGRYNMNAHCLLGSIAALYRRLLKNCAKTSSLETNDIKTSSHLDTRGVDATDGSSRLDVVQEYLLQPLPTANKQSRSTVKGFDTLSAASEALELWKQDLNMSSAIPNIAQISRHLLPLIRSHAPFGSPRWILGQVLHESYPEEYQWRRHELQFALDLCKHGSINIQDVLAKAFVLAATILAKREVPFDDPNELLKSPNTVRGYALAADIIHAALFHTWPQRQDMTEYFTRRLKYEVLPQHKECLREVIAKRAEWHPHMVIRSRKGDKAVVRDWAWIRYAKAASMEIVEDDHPLSFDRFWHDLALITGDYKSVIPAIASKYKILFDRDIVEDLKSIQDRAPQSCYSDSFVKGIEEGYVPYRYAYLLTVPRSTTVMVNKTSLALLGAYVNYYISLVGPADAVMSQGTSTERESTLSQEVSTDETCPSANREEVDHTSEPSRPGPKEQMAQLTAILRRAPAQKPPTAKDIPIEPKELHPVAQYLLGTHEQIPD